MAQRVIDTVLTAFDRRRFPWVVEDREPYQVERAAAVLASAALMATQRLSTARHSEGKNLQEQAVEHALLAAGFQKVTTRTVTTLPDAPAPGHDPRNLVAAQKHGLALFWAYGLDAFVQWIQSTRGY